MWPERGAPRSGDAVDVDELGAIVNDMFAVGKYIFFALGVPIEIMKNYGSTMTKRYFRFNTVPKGTGDGSQR